MRWQLVILFPPALLAASPVLRAQTEQRPPGFTERVDVNLRTVLAIVTDSRGRLREKPLSTEEVQVFEDGIAARVIAVDPVGRPTGRSGPVPSGPTTPPQSSPQTGASGQLKHVLYIDSSLLQRGSVKTVLAGISENLGALLAGGSLEIALADPDPTLYLAATADVARAREVLASLSGKKFGRERLREVRTEFLQEEGLMIGKDGRVSEPARVAQARFAMQEEIQVIQHSLRRLSDWVAARVTRDPAVLFLVLDGFDADVSEFYRKSLKDESQAQRLRQEFGYQVQKSVGELAVLLASQSLLTIPVAVGGGDVIFTTDAATTGLRPYNDLGNQIRGTSPLLFVRPLEPLREIAETTGGEVATRADRFGDVLDRLSRAVAITYRMERPADGKPHKLDVRSLREGVTLRAARSVGAGTSEMVAAARSVEVLENPAAGGGLPVTASVEFLEVKPNKKCSGMLHISIDLAGIAEAIEAVGPGRVRVTVAFEAPAPVLRQSERLSDTRSQDLDRHLPAEPSVQRKNASVSVSNEELDLIRTGSGTTWRHEVALQWSPETRRIAVTVEELKTGTWGSRVVELPTPDPAGRGPAAQKPPTGPPGDSELPATFELVEKRRDGKKLESISARLHVTIDVESILPEIARAGTWRPRVTVEAEGPNIRLLVAKSELSLPFDIAVDRWDFFVPVTWPANAYRLLVAIQEPNSGAHASAVIELPRNP